MLWTVSKRIFVLANIACALPMHVGAQATRCVATPTSLTPAGWSAPVTAVAGAARGPLRLIREIPLPGPALAVPDVHQLQPTIPNVLVCRT